MQPELSKKELHLSHFGELTFSRWHLAVALERQNKTFYGKCFIYLILTVHGKSTCEWHTDDIRATNEWHKNDIRVQTSAYEWHTSIYQCHTHDTQVDASDIQMTCASNKNKVNFFKPFW